MADDKKKKEIPVPRGKDLKSLAEAINKHFKGNVVNVQSDVNEFDMSSTFKYSTGVLSLDKYIGTGGLLCGRVMDVYGWEGTGKTLTALTVAASVQRTMFTPSALNPTGKGRVAFLDAEGTYSPSMASAIGVDPDQMLLFRSSPEKINTAEDYFAIMAILIQNGIELIIVDSTPALIPESRLHSVPGQGQKATQAQVMSEGLQQLTTLLNAYQQSVVWFINQMRMKPMVMFGSPEDHTGGSALRFYATYGLEVKKLGDIIKNVPNGNGGFDDKRIGVSIKATLGKNKTAVIPVDHIEYDVYFETTTDKDGIQYFAGVDVFKDMFVAGVRAGVIKQSSSWYQYGDVKGNGEANFIAALRGADPSVLQSIRDEVLGNSPTVDGTVVEDKIPVKKADDGKLVIIPKKLAQ